MSAKTPRNNYKIVVLKKDHINCYATIRKKTNSIKLIFILKSLLLLFLPQAFLDGHWDKKPILKYRVEISQGRNEFSFLLYW